MGQKPSRRASFSCLSLFALMKRIMFCGGKDDQVFKSIVIRDSINVMNMFVSKKRSSKLFNHKKSMLSNPLLPSPNFNVTTPMLALGANHPIMNSALPKRAVGTLWLSLRRAGYCTKGLFAQIWLKHISAIPTRLQLKFSHIVLLCEEHNINQTLCKQGKICYV